MLKLLMTVNLLAAALCFFLVGSLLNVEGLQDWVAILAAAGVTHAVTFFGLLTRRLFGWVLQLGLACVWLVAFPFGTLAGVLVLIYLFKPEVRAVFRETTAAALPKTVARPFFVALLLFTQVLVTVAILVPGVIGGASRGRQYRTIADMRVIGLALELHYSRHGQYPRVSSVAELRKALDSDQSPDLKEQDDWGHDFRLQTWKQDPAAKGPDFYVLASAGSDGRWENEDPRSYAEAITDTFEADLVFSNGIFLRKPAGLKE